ncbi:MAG: 2'-5' RNA ligase family protein [Bacteroidia bacterium]|nr:2'-5' RNA ligase family protein [Bacteroidia bacterium]
MKSFSENKTDVPVRFFVALVPSEPLLSELENMKLHIMNNYGCKAALRSPAHITIHRPFLCRSVKADFIRQSFQRFEFNNFDICLKDFGFFPENRVVFVRPVENRQLHMLYENFRDFASREWNLLTEKKHQRPFHPHITLAFRDVKPDTYDALHREFSNRTYEACFRADCLSLLEWDSLKWKVVERCSFKVAG